jgi:hypothetical protein
MPGLVAGSPAAIDVFALAAASMRRSPATTRSPSSSAWPPPLVIGMSPRINHVGGCFDDLPEGTVGTVVVNAPSVVWAQFLQHAEADEPTEFLSHLSLQDHLAGWFGLVET